MYCMTMQFKILTTLNTFRTWVHTPYLDHTYSMELMVHLVSLIQSFHKTQRLCLLHFLNSLDSKQRKLTMVHLTIIFRFVPLLCLCYVVVVRVFVANNWFISYTLFFTPLTAKYFIICSSEVTQKICNALRVKPWLKFQNTSYWKVDCRS